jgi:hypothetical protein
LKKDGIIAVAMPGLRKEFDGNVPDVMKPFWTEEVNDTFHDMDWWQSLWGRSGNITLESCFTHKCHDIAWKDWLECDNPYAKGDIKMMEAEGGRYFSTLGMIAKLR